LDGIGNLLDKQFQEKCAAVFRQELLQSNI